MNYLMFGLSHHTAPLDLLEQVALSADAASDLMTKLCATEVVHEAVCFATCNRLEVYVAAEAFHPGVDAVCGALRDVTGVDLTDHSAALRVHFGADVVRHVFSVAAGLESMAIGENQIVGQVRQALHTGQQIETVGRYLDPLLQRALRVAKRVHHETDVSQAGPSMVQVSLAEAERQLGGLVDARAVVFGAGAMSGLVMSTLAGFGCHRIHVVNRSAERAHRLVSRYGGHVVQLDDAAVVRQAVQSADVVVSCTGAQGYVITPGLFAMSEQDGRSSRRVLIDLAMPRDIDPNVDAIPGVRRLDLQALGELLTGHHTQESLATAADLVATEVQAFLAEHSQETVGPTLVALQRRADEVVADELNRLVNRLGTDINETTVDEIRITLRRVTNKLLHTPTVRMKALAAEQEQAPDYVSALRNLFDLECPDQQPSVLGVTPHTPREQPQP